MIALGLYAGEIHDPDLAWGYMSRDLLLPGAIGLMLVGIWQPTCRHWTLVLHPILPYSFAIFELPFPGRTEQHYLLVGRTVIAISLLGGIEQPFLWITWSCSNLHFSSCHIWGRYLAGLYLETANSYGSHRGVHCFAIFAVIPISSSGWIGRDIILISCCIAAQ